MGESSAFLYFQYKFIKAATNKKEKMFTPHQYTNCGRHGQIFNVDGTQFCSWMVSSSNKVMVFNDPITQVTFLTQEDLYLAKVWVINHLISNQMELSGIT